MNLLCMYTMGTSGKLNADVASIVRGQFLTNFHRIMYEIDRPAPTVDTFVSDMSPF